MASPDTLAPTAEAAPGPPPRPKLRRPERRPDPARWATVIPPALLAEVGDVEPLVAHRKLVERVEVATAKLAELRAAHAKATEADQLAEQAFAAGKRVKLLPPTAPGSAEAVAQAERELELLERQLPRSADELRVAAYPYLEQAQQRLEQLLDADDEEIAGHIAAALAALDARAELGRQAAWVSAAFWESTVMPYDERARKVASNQTAAELRRTLAELTHEREETRRKRFERKVEIEMLFNPDRSPKRLDGTSTQQRRREAERIVRARGQPQ